jgi:hypothetical protein
MLTPHTTATHKNSPPTNGPPPIGGTPTPLEELTRAYAAHDQNLPRQLSTKQPAPVESQPNSLALPAQYNCEQP